MSEYPEPDEEYELLHMEEMEAMADMEREMLMAYQTSIPKKSKASLNFDHLSENKIKNGKEETNLSTTGLEANENKSQNINSKKRNFSSDSLLDMTSDLEVEEPPSKKQKSCVPAKQLVQLSYNSDYGVTSFRVPQWSFITISTSHGERLYVKLSNGYSPKNLTSFLSTKKDKLNLLETPYHTLKANIQESLSVTARNEVEVEISEIGNQADLWVEKFRPKTYFDLLSDEAVNRTLLNWLKMWDKIVFNKELKEKILLNHNKENTFKSNLNKGLDNNNRPYYKMALLCGPPGLGKTTLAHIAAVMAGYNVIEVNASDDRSIETLRSKLDDATQMQAVMGKRKPSCLILDEIDGAPIQTVDFLLKYLDGQSGEKGKRGKKDIPVKIVKRPVICICNELYAPSLRQLRQQAFVIHFPNTSSTKLAQRLLEICKKQDIKTDVSALTLLCDKAQNDIRSCISTLHFFKIKNDQRFKSTDVLKTNLGLKDIQKSIFNIWKEIFYNPVQKNLFSNALSKATENEISSDVNYSKKGMDRLKNIVKICQSSGDYERLMEGVYENFLKSKFSGGMETILNGLEWFCWFDCLDTHIKMKQNYTLMTYLPYSFGMWQSLYSSSSFWKISYPVRGYENRMKELKCSQIMSDVSRGLNPTLKSFNRDQSLLFDTLPLINAILKPPLRPVNPTLFNEAEKKDFKHLIDVMMDFNLNYIQARGPDGTYSYQLDPNIEEIIRFVDTNESSNRRSYSYGMKQIISHELELERMRRSEGSKATEADSRLLNINKSTGASGPLYSNSPDLKIKEVQVKENEVQYKDFFGRVVSRPESSAQGIAIKSDSIKSPIWFNFKEGYNNAVKKDIIMSDLL